MYATHKSRQFRIHQKPNLTRFPCPLPNVTDAYKNNIPE